MTRMQRLMAAVATAGTLLFASVAAQAAVPVLGPGTYNFSGTCLDCDEVPTPATAQLILGESFGTSSFSYQSNLYDLESTFIEVAQLGLMDDQGNADALVLFGVGDQIWEFTSNLAGSWNLSLFSVSEDFGRNGVWAVANRVPEPTSLASLGVMASLTLLRRRKRNADAARII